MSEIVKADERVYGFGILGCGMIANMHAKAVEDLADATLVGVADSRVE